MVTSNTTIAKNTLFLSFRMLFVLFVSLYTSRIFLNVLGVVDYGISNIITGFVSMFGFFNTSLANGIQRFYNAELGYNGKEGVTKVYNTSLIIQSLIALCVIILLESVGLWYFYNKLVIPIDRQEIAFWIYQFSIVSAVLVIIQSPFSAAIMAYEKMNVYATVSIIEVILKLVFAIILPYINIDSLLLYGFFYMLISFLSFTMYFIYSKIRIKELYLKRNYDKRMFKEMLTFSGWNMCGTFACMAREQGLNIVLNLFFGPIVNAARGIAYQVSGAMQGFVSNLSLAAKPQMIQSFSMGDSSKTIRLMYIMSKLGFIFLYILSVPVILNIDYILNIWLGDIVPEHSANFIVLIILTNFINNLNMPLSNIVYATGNMRNYELVFSILNLLIIPFSFIAFKFGALPETAFLIYFIMTVFVQLGCLLVLRTLVTISIKYYIKELIIPLTMIGLLNFLILYGIHFIVPHNLIGIVIEYIIITISSSLFFYIFSLDSNEKIFVKGILIKIIKK